jgi:hypothetical protein
MVDSVEEESRRTAAPGVQLLEQIELDRVSHRRIRRRLDAGDQATLLQHAIRTFGLNTA